MVEPINELLHLVLHKWFTLNKGIASSWARITGFTGPAQSNELRNFKNKIKSSPWYSEAGMALTAKACYSPTGHKRSHRIPTSDKVILKPWFCVCRHRQKFDHYVTCKIPGTFPLLAKVSDCYFPTNYKQFYFCASLFSIDKIYSDDQPFYDSI